MITGCRVETNVSNFEGYALCSINRCGTISMGSARRMGYTEADVHAFEKRVNQLVKSIKSMGEVCRPLCVAYEYEGQKYIIDGQGRKTAVGIINGEGSLPQRLTLDFVIYTVDSMEDIQKGFLSYNDSRPKQVRQKPLGLLDKLRPDMRTNEDLRDGINFATKFQDKHGLVQTTTLNFLYGQGSTKQGQVREMVKQSRLFPWVKEMCKDFEDYCKAIEENPNLTLKDIRTLKKDAVMLAIRNFYSRFERSAVPENLIMQYDGEAEVRKETKNAFKARFIDFLKKTDAQTFMDVLKTSNSNPHIPTKHLANFLLKGNGGKKFKKLAEWAVYVE